MSERYDCVVVGAGPGGSTAARELAAVGAKVLLLDRATFPRDKPCGGGVLISAAVQLPFSLDAVSERTVSGFRISYRRGASVVHRFEKPLALMTQRARLDAYLVEQAVAEGVVFEDGRRVTDVLHVAGGVELRLRGGDCVQGVAVVAADGANGVMRRALGLAPLRSAVALEANVGGVPDAWQDSVGLELGSMPGGYGWVFPKGDHCNVGVGGWPVGGPTLRRELDAYAASEGFDAARLCDHRGHSLPLRDPGSALVSGRVAFVGDAAGLIDPLSGEGIGNAIRSGTMAASWIGRLLAGEVHDLEGYRRAVEGEIEPELAVSRQLQALFQQQPWPYVQLLQRSGRFWRSFCRIVRGEATYAGFKGRLGPFGAIVDAAAWNAQRGVRRRSGWGAPGSPHI